MSVDLMMLGIYEQFFVITYYRCLNFISILLISILLRNIAMLLRYIT